MLKLAGPLARAKAGLAAGFALAAGAPAAAGDMDLRVDLQAWESADQGLVALLYDGSPADPASQLERVVRLPDRSAREPDKPRLTFRVTDLEPGRYGVAIYPNKALGRLDLTGLGVPPTDKTPEYRDRRRPRFQHALVRIDDTTLSLRLKMTY